MPEERYPFLGTLAYLLKALENSVWLGVAGTLVASLAFPGSLVANWPFVVILALNLALFGVMCRVGRELLTLLLRTGEEVEELRFQVTQLRIQMTRPEDVEVFTGPGVDIEQDGAE